MPEEKPDFIDADFRVLDDKGNPVTEFSNRSKQGPFIDNRDVRRDRPNFIYTSYQEELAEYQNKRHQYLDKLAMGKTPLGKPTPPRPVSAYYSISKADIKAYQQAARQYEQDEVDQYYRDLKAYQEQIEAGDDLFARRPIPPKALRNQRKWGRFW